jgi:hypothetical protein
MLGWISMHNKATRRSGPEAYIVYVEVTQGARWNVMVIDGE